MFVIFMRNVGVIPMSKTIVREKFRDFFKGRLSFEEELEIKDAYSSLYAILIDADVFTPAYLTRFSQGFTIEELSEIYGAPIEDIKNSLGYAYELFGEVLQLDDSMIVRRVDKELRPSASRVLSKIYSEFLEIE